MGICSESEREREKRESVGCERGVSLPDMHALCPFFFFFLLSHKQQIGLKRWKFTTGETDI